MMMATAPCPAREDPDVLEVWLPLLVFASLGASWYHVLRLREHATAHARRLCERHGLQLLDDSVALHRLRVNWRRGALHALREYRFDTSRGDDDRQTASITLLGDRIVSASVPGRVDSGHDAATPVPGDLHVTAPQHVDADRDNKVVPITRARRTLH
jgi:hypothetical protein